MPDISEVEDTLIEAVADILSPNTFMGNTLYQPQTVMTTAITVFRWINNAGVNVPVKVRLYRGWPVPKYLGTDLQAGVANVSIFPVAGMTRLLSKWAQDEYTNVIVPITFTATVQGQNQVLFGGTATSGQVTGVATGPGIIEDAYCIRLNNNDTPSGVAATLASIIPNAHASGPLLTLDGVHKLIAGVVSDSTTNFESELQAQMFDIHIWAPDPETRDVLGKALSSGMSQVTSLAFKDGSFTENMLYRGTWVEDIQQSTTAWHRYQRYEVIYPTVIQTVNPGILFLGIRLNETRLIGEFDYRSSP